MKRFLESTDLIDWQHPEIWPEPLPVVVEALRACATYDELWEKLPDIPLLKK